MAKFSLVRGIVLPFLALFCFINLAYSDESLTRLSIAKQDGSEAIFYVEMAKTAHQKQKGLMFRTFMPDEQGMLFLYHRPQIVTMWMKNTYISLDMIFIDDKGIIRHIIANTSPLSTDILSSQKQVSAVLELNAGQASHHNITIGDRVSW